MTTVISIFEGRANQPIEIRHGLGLGGIGPVPFAQEPGALLESSSCRDASISL
jgi:hypothetical protein